MTEEPCLPLSSEMSSACVVNGVLGGEAPRLKQRECAKRRT